MGFVGTIRGSYNEFEPPHSQLPSDEKKRHPEQEVVVQQTLLLM